MKITVNTPARDFNTLTSERFPFTLSRLKSCKILLSFYRNGACAFSNYRLHLLKKYKKEFIARNTLVVSVFESMPRLVIPYAGRTELPFYILSDPMGLIYDLYEVENSEEKIRNAIISGITANMSREAADAGIVSVPEENSNFFRLPADFLIDENFSISKIHYSNSLIDFMPIDEIIKWIQLPKHIQTTPVRYHETFISRN
jgi:peroxiredoxin